ncbi:arsenic metallochaperone ArsD family protein [Erysipelothrix urinaevulpis]|uniref:arsenic metallochaperone ArsD family protein n=1 Tax=Erysipelothrix urinaevulpis TaxID=2683717 RepID=UPI00135A7461|nr:arsenic metallochaperone ArsD family protein [Erysipelothrix urinaevulpis]
MKLTAYLTAESLGSVLGIEKDVKRYQFLDTCKELEKSGIEVEIYDAHNHAERVKDISVLPSFYVDNELKFEGKYPNTQELQSIFKLELNENKQTSDLIQAANDGRIGYCCGVGTDIYLDPNDEE